MSRRSRRFSMQNSGTICLAISALAGIAVILACLLGFSVILTKINAPGLLISVLSTIALCIGGYCGGYLCARKRRKNGMMMGIICGVIIFMIVLIIGAVFAKAVLGFSAGGKLLLTMFFGASGGIVGVNTKHRRY